MEARDFSRGRLHAEIDKMCKGEETEDVADLRRLFWNLKSKYPLAYIEKAYDEVF